MNSTPQLPFTIVTSSYASWSPQLGQRFTPVRTSIGVPKFLPVAAHWPRCSELVPWGLLDVHDHDEFERRYRARIDRHGPARIAESLTAIWRMHNERALALLCFEDVSAGQSCHRTIAAAWLHEHTGQLVAELEQAPLQARLWA